MIRGVEFLAADVHQQVPCGSFPYLQFAWKHLSQIYSKVCMLGEIDWHINLVVRFHLEHLRLCITKFSVMSYSSGLWIHTSSCCILFFPVSDTSPSYFWVICNYLNMHTIMFYRYMICPRTDFLMLGERGFPPYSLGACR